ncbi:Polyprotein [Heterostelium album PN500]|uniref:Polyprotein n=1 Tax=Heterostelium pallidum (strain ATCC 26659 / Pp 5 / PN500) TaxID=670386 RepID=D3AXU3_HETP5|nr:Polyprotein [Heterostelium album PN500]EFA85770.1 Polyprotein [Heterostelium album PN500]|eukprot:XP_020437876.1 Polyprotein [Heterostelium album PN500]
MLAVNAVGFFFTTYKFPSIKIKFGDYFKQVGQAFADLGALFALILSIGTVVRIPFLLYSTFSDSQQPTGRYSKQDTVLVYAYREASAARTWDGSTIKIIRQVLWALLDLLMFVLFTIFIVGTIYRLYITIKKLRAPNIRAGDRRFEVLKQIWYIFVDIVMVLFMLFLIPTVYRLPRIYRKLKSPTNNKSYRYIIWVQWLKLMRDIPYGAMAALVTILVWRAPFMIRDCNAATKNHQRRRCILHHFGWLFVDLIDTPFILCSFIILGTGWRAYFFVRGFPTGVSRWVQRRYIMKQFVFLLLDIPTAIAFLILMLTVYRAPTTIRHLKAAKIFSYNEGSNNNSNSNNNTSVNMDTSNANGNADDEDNPAPAATVSSTTNQSWHQIVGKQFFLLIIDIPFPVLLLLTMWRLPILISRLREIDDPARKYAQRRLLILRYLLYVLFDILCIVPTLIIFITLWRIPSFIKVIREYKRGDNEHREVAIVFQNLIIDIPFVILGLFTMIFPWRGIYLVRAVIKDCKTDGESRLMALRYFGIMFIDIISFIFMLVILVTVWRIPTFIKVLKAELKREVRSSKWKETQAVIEASGMTLIFILLDMLGFMQALVILICITRVKLCWQAIMKEKSASKEKFEIHDIRPYLSFYFMESLRDLPHLVFAPIKAVGLVFFPLHLYLSKRTKTPTNSFLNLILIWLHECSISFLDYWEFDKFAVFNIVGALISVPNELGIAMVGINSVYMFLVTLGSPLWNQKRINANWTQLGKAQGPMVILEYITVILQALFFPVFLFMQGILLMLPIIISLGAYNVKNLGFADYWHAFFSNRAFWHDNTKQFSVGIWFAQAFWVLVMIVCWNVTFLVGKKFFPLFSPWKAYYWLLKKVFVGRFWGFYKMLLAKPTYVCYRLRRACFIGEFLMFPLFLIWTCWPIIIPIVTKIYYIFIPSGLLTGFLIFMSYRIIRNNWGEPVIADATPKVALTGVFVDVPEDGGIIFTFEGQKDPNFVIADSALSLVGDEIWKTIENAIGKTKVRAALMFTGYPISLCPQFLKIEEVNQQRSNITFKIAIGTAGSGLLLQKESTHKDSQQYYEAW